MNKTIFNIFYFFLPFLAKFFGNYCTYLMSLKYIHKFPKDSEENKKFYKWLEKYNKNKYK